MRKKPFQHSFFACGVVSLLLREGAWFCFGVQQRFAKLDKLIVERTFKGENV